jgi:class 3 adenylate cyclase/tetratricopeptide (TPR) repeat protein
VERKLASVLFVDIVDSTALVSGTDPEVARRRVTQFFERASQCVEAHGGTVEKFAGDAVMAAFGTLQAHEDDAERAVRAGLAILDATEELGLQARAGIESGEVVVDGTESTFATGEAVNIAARLQQAAAPRQLLIGPTTHRLSFGRVRVEDVGPLDVRGRAEPVWVWSAVGVSDGAGRTHTIEAPFVAREHELELLENTFKRAVGHRRAHLVTIYGDAGIGKSRLAEEFLESLEGATVLKGRCLPYGEGVTYWPLAEMVKSAAGIADDDPLDVAIEKLRECCPAEEVAELDGAPSSDLAAEAAGALHKAGKRALAREANRTARKLLLRAVELEPTLERRYYAAKAAWRMSDYPTLAREMEKVRKAGAEAGDPQIEGLALTALGEVAVLREGDVPKARELTDRALELLSNRDGARFAALATRTSVEWSIGDLEEHECVVREALELAREIDSKAMESEALQSLASNKIARLRLEEAEACLRQAVQLAEETGSVVGRGVALRFGGGLHLERGELDEAEAALEESVSLLSEADAAWSLGRALNYAAWVAWRKGNTQRAEKLFRESIRILKPIEDRATLCETQRGLAELLVDLGRIDEAETFALAARETVGPQDATSIATTTAALATVRAAQGRDDEAEQLYREALAGLEGTGFKRNQLELSEMLARFLRERGRVDEAREYEDGLPEPSPAQVA